MLQNKELIRRARALLRDYNNWNGDDYDNTAALMDDMGTFMKDLVESECPVQNKTRTYFQPEAYYDDGTNIEYGDIPDELSSFQAFASREDCEEWLRNNGYEPGSFVIMELHDDDIEGVTIIDGDGDIIEINEEE